MSADRLTVAEIQTAVAFFYHIPPREMTSARRARSIAYPRQVAMYLARTMTPKSYPHIGRLFGNRDHSTVIHAVHAVEKRCANDAEYLHDVESLRGLLS